MTEEFIASSFDDKKLVQSQILDLINKIYNRHKELCVIYAQDKDLDLKLTELLNAICAELFKIGRGLNDD